MAGFTLCSFAQIFCQSIEAFFALRFAQAFIVSSALVIITGSRLKIPLSTTHCQIGATVGVGALENPKTCSGINCKIFAKTALGWIITCIIVGITAGVLTAQGAYAPAIWNYCPGNQTI